MNNNNNTLTISPKIREAVNKRIKLAEKCTTLQPQCWTACCPPRR